MTPSNEVRVPSTEGRVPSTEGRVSDRREPKTSKNDVVKGERSELNSVVTLQRVRPYQNTARSKVKNKWGDSKIKITLLPKIKLAGAGISIESKVLKDKL